MQREDYDCIDNSQQNWNGASIARINYWIFH